MAAVIPAIVWPNASPNAVAFILLNVSLYFIDLRVFDIDACCCGCICVTGGFANSKLAITSLTFVSDSAKSPCDIVAPDLLEKYSLKLEEFDCISNIVTALSAVGIPRSSL